MKNRGPDDTSYVAESTLNITRLNEDQLRMQLTKQEIADYTPYTIIHGYHRLSVNDSTKNGSQPFEDPIAHKIRKYPELRTRPKRKLLCNGEIYNYQQIRESEGFDDKDLQSDCDVEVILPLYIKYGIEETIKRINGDYTFVVTDNVETFDLKTMQVYVVRDVLGIKPLYMVKHTRHVFYMFISELKGVPKYILEDPDYTIQEVPPGTMWTFENSILNKNKCEFIRYSDWDYYKDLNNCTVTSADPDIIAEVYVSIQNKLREAIVSRYTTSNQDVGVLLSGGFDSSVVLSILVNHLHSLGHNFEAKPIYAFTIGDLQNDDVKYAKQVVEYLEQKYNIDIHHHIVSLQDSNWITRSIEDVVYGIETYDPTTVRGAYPYILLFKYIQENASNVKVLLTGEGLDEVCGYHRLFDMSDAEFQKKSVKLLKYISKFDALRADKAAGLYGLEVRHPFLDRNFVEYMLQIHPRLKRPQVYQYNKPPVEKYLIRKAFDLADLETTSDDNQVLPNDILWRPIQDACDCFHNIQSIVQQECERLYTDQDFSDYLNSPGVRIDQVTKPTSKEEMHYRRLFEKWFGTRLEVIPKFWQQLWD